MSATTTNTTRIETRMIVQIDPEDVVDYRNVFLETKKVIH
jgi:hypothetical protein